MKVNMIFADNPFKDDNILSVAYLDDQIPTTLLYITLQNMVTVFCNPNNMST